MKKFFTYVMYVILPVIAFGVTSCQDEYEEINIGNEPQAITTNSLTSQLIQRTTTNDGSYDNIVDGTSCSDIKFPYTVEVNGTVLTLESKEDIGKIEAIFDAVEDDEDLLKIFFPIIITTADFSEITLNRIEELRELADDCTEGGDDDIECIDFVYPLTVYSFNVNLEQTSSFIAESDRDLKLFFKALDEDNLVSLDFPISLKLHDDTYISVESNEELTTAIENAKDACDEDDDADYNDDDFDKELIDTILPECVWIIQKVKPNGEERDRLLGYEFQFMTEGVVTLTNGVVTLEGNWEVELNTDEILVLDITIDNEPDVSFEWPIIQLDNERLKFKDEATGYELRLQQVCNENELDGGVVEVRNFMKMDGEWTVDSYIEGNEDRTNIYTGYSLDFMDEEQFSMMQGGTAFGDGLWRVIIDGDDILKVYLNFGENSLLEDLTDDWDFVSKTGDRIELKDISDNGTISTLILKK